MAIKYYVVWKGRNPGIYSDWERCKSQVDGFPGARFKSFTSRAEAESALKGVGTSSAMPLGGNVGLTQPAATGPGSTSSAGTAKKTAGPSSTSPRTWTAAEVTAAAIEVKIFTDGGCEPNPGKSGSGLALYRNNVLAELWYGLHSPHGTNNTAELNAFHRGLIIAKAEVDKLKTVGIFCDSKYAIQCITQWAAGWKKKGWKKPGGEIKNLELIQEIFSLHQTLHDRVQVMHVNGHVGVEGNELADRMSVLAIRSRTTDFIRYDRALDPSEILAL